LAYPFAGDGAPLRTTLAAGGGKPGNECSNRWSSFTKRLITRSSAYRQNIVCILHIHHISRKPQQ